MMKEKSSVQKEFGLTLTVGLGMATVLLLAFITPVVGSSPPSRGPDSFEIGLQSRQFTPKPGISPEIQAALQDRGEGALAQGAAKIHTILQLDYIPTPEQNEWLRQQGIELLTYIPNYAWLAAVPATNPAKVAGVPGVRWVGSLTVQDKLQPELQAQELGRWAYDPAGNLIALLVQFHRDVSLQQGRAVVEAHGGQVVDQAASINTLIVHLHKDKVAALAGEDVIEWIEQPLPPLEPINDGNRARVGANTLQAGPYNLDGTNVDVLVYDAGRVYSHSDLDSKRTWGDNTSFVEHATHVACTVLGDGTGNYTYRGMAPNAELLSMGFEYDGTGVFLHTNPGDLQNDLNYAKNTWSPSADLFNASMGTNTAPNGFPCSFEGNYGATSQLVDAIVRGSLGEPFIAAWASGNERQGTARCGSTYRTTAPPACAKNPIHSGATDSADDSMSSFSSWGPCDDGRLKPTISAPGVNVMSCNHSNGYVNLSGTSMASPTTAGIIALMLEQYRITYSTSGEFLPSTAKALLIHTAVDLGNTGPDYQFGYGRVDGLAAVGTIISRGFRQETITAQGQIDEYAITVSGSPAQLKASLAWDDPAGSLAALKKLVNDLDLELQAPNGTIYYPWVLDPSNPGNPATRGVDNTNNQEQLVVNSPMNGTWMVRVKGSTVPDAPQSYSLVFPGADTAPKITTPGGGPPDPPSTSCSEALTNGGFEAGVSPWVWSGSATQSSTYALGGTYSGRVGGTTDSHFYQQIALPSNFHNGTLTYWVRMVTSEANHPYDYFDVEIRDGSDKILTTLQSLNDGDLSYRGTWRQETFTLGSEYAGRTIRLRFGADVDSTVNTYWYIDGVSLNACLATGGCGDNYESDDIYTDAKSMTVNGTAQTHNFHVAGDEDWVKFTVTANEPYTITTSSLGVNADTVLELYDTDGMSLLEDNDNCPGGGKESCINNWSDPHSGTYFIKVRQRDGTGGCTGYGYKLGVVGSGKVFLPIILTSSSLESQLISLINAERSSRGLETLRQSSILMQVAEAHSQDMVDRDFLGHVNPDGLGPGDRLTNAGYDWIAWGETIGASYSTPQAMLGAWMNSSDHREILLSGAYTEMGVGYVAGGTYGHYWTAIFAKPAP